MQENEKFSEYLIFADESGDHGLSSINPENPVIESIPFLVIATAIDKRNLKKDYPNSDNPYLIALEFCLEHAYTFLKEENQLKHLTHIVVECRGKTEDQDLEIAFKRISDRARHQDKQYPFDIKFANKKTNSCGLQIADLVAHPIARHVVRPEQLSIAFEVVKKKLLGYPKYGGIGLKCYP